LPVRAERPAGDRDQQTERPWEHVPPGCVLDVDGDDGAVRT
jgi:hypothetical protein